jgi:hypothetical protein
LRAGNLLRLALELSRRMHGEDGTSRRYG